MKKLIQANLWYLVPFLIWWIGLFIIVALVGDKELFLSLNAHHNKGFDVLFAFITHLPETAGIVLVLCFAFFLSIKTGLTAGFAIAATGALTSFFKMQVFDDHLRPSMHFEHMPLHFVEGVQLAKYFSFPSGHTSIAFALSFILCLVLAKGNKIWALIFLAIAVLVGYSRVHLSQHFPEDILAGSMLGIVTVLVVYTIFNHLFMRLNYQWLQFSPLETLSKKD